MVHSKPLSMIVKRPVFGLVGTGAKKCGERWYVIGYPSADP